MGFDRHLPLSAKSQQLSRPFAAFVVTRELHLLDKKDNFLRIRAGESRLLRSSGVDTVDNPSAILRHRADGEIPRNRDSTNELDRTVNVEEQRIAFLFAADNDMEVVLYFIEDCLVDEPCV